MTTGLDLWSAIMREILHLQHIEILPFIYPCIFDPTCENANKEKSICMIHLIYIPTLSIPQHNAETVVATQI